MKIPTLVNINRSQEEYLAILLQYKEYVQANDLSVTKICALLDEVKCFWLKQIRPIEFELEELTESRTCFVLSGAIFLNVSEFEHFYFKSLGDCHIISDPFSKFDMIFRHHEEEINVVDMVDYFKRAFFDTLEILTTYKEYFYVLPIQEIAVEDQQQHRDLLDIFFWRFISSAFHNEFNSFEDFYKQYHSLEEVEADLSKNISDYIVFNDLNERMLPLRERLEIFTGQSNTIALNVSFASEIQMFLISIFSYIAQIADILYVCSVLRLNPYIRFDVTFSYFTIVMNVFTDDEPLRNMIEKTLLCYIFYRSIDESNFIDISFPSYCNKLKEKSLLNSVLEKIHDKEIDMFNDDSSQLVKIIKDAFEAIF